MHVLNGYALARQDGATPVSVATQNGHVEVVRLLIAAGADVKASRNVSMVGSAEGLGDDRHDDMPSKS